MNPASPSFPKGYHVIQVTLWMVLRNPSLPPSPSLVGEAKNQESPNFTAKMRQKRKEMGRARESDQSESDDELESGSVVLHQLFRRKIVLRPDGIVVKSGDRITIGEVEALKVASQAGIPAPRLRKVVDKTVDDRQEIHMNYMPGESLEKLWPDLSPDQRKGIAQQLRGIIDVMRSITPPPGFIGACDRTGIRDTRVISTYYAPPCHEERGFNEYLLSSIHGNTPPMVRVALSRRVRYTHHRIVLSHYDLSPRNIIVQDDRITGLVDWEDSGWYPEYWEYFKFFQRPAEKEWKEYAEETFSDVYHDELIDLFALTRWQPT